jgi:uncharacterized membrane protein HdeD (DUF308 family)
MTAYLVDEVGMEAPEARREADDLVRDAGEVRSLLREMWWALGLRGVLALTVGVLFLIRPVQALATLVVVFGAWVFVDGVITMVSAIARHKSWQMGVLGVVGIGLGAWIVTRPASASVVFLILAAAWIMTHGVTEIALSANLRKGTPGRFALIVMGVVSFAFGIFLIVAPTVGLTVLGWWIGIYALFNGALFVGLAFHVRRVKHRLADLAPSREVQPLPT